MILSLTDFSYKNLRFSHLFACLNFLRVKDDRNLSWLLFLLLVTLTNNVHDFKKFNFYIKKLLQKAINFFNFCIKKLLLEGICLDCCRVTFMYSAGPASNEKDRLFKLDEKRFSNMNSAYNNLSKLRPTNKINDKVQSSSGQLVPTIFVSITKKMIYKISKACLQQIKLRQNIRSQRQFFLSLSIFYNLKLNICILLFFFGDDFFLWRCISQIEVCFYDRRIYHSINKASFEMTFLLLHKTIF
ncbi:hypothetical protein IEQ34_001300 [Dendrobium chrysotoxum]|uniref:Uncharacterized protein n=1 Tax=Dendrobium chrysotoxum TaxID=161865 RepID=A0AAV7HQ20_DENCH|nr:hypothetical protein IEQ34_001300 [Dendrobium chrysotoxum]